MMYQHLYLYLVQYKELALPGIGTFVLERSPATIDFPGKKIVPPVYSIGLEPSSYLPGQRFFHWLAAILGISDREAIFRFNDFSFELKKSLADGDRIIWNGIGELKKGESGEIILDPEPGINIEKAIPLEKILRDKTEHKVRVGEEERSSVEMSSLLEKEDDKKISWWVFSVALAILALMFIGWYLSEHGIEIFSISNSSNLVPDEAAPGLYKLLQ